MLVTETITIMITCVHCGGHGRGHGERSGGDVDATGGVGVVVMGKNICVFEWKK